MSYAPTITLEKSPDSSTFRYIIEFTNEWAQETPNLEVDLPVLIVQAMMQEMLNRQRQRILEAWAMDNPFPRERGG